MFKILFTLIFSVAFKIYAGTSYGTWDSSISAESITKGPASAHDMQVDGDYTYWSESRPENKGRSTIVRRDALGKIEEITPPDFNARTFVHEYGGGAFTVVNGTIYSSNGDDGAIYIIEPNSMPRRLTTGDTRFADMHLTSYGLVAVGEHHGSKESVENFLALIDTQTGSYKKLAHGYDFYSSPAISTDGKKIAWISWNHPNMPWTNTELWTAEFDEKGELKNALQICGSLSESIFEPQWSPDGILYFVTDRDSCWWNVHRYVNGRVENVCPMEAEVAEPLWTFGMSTYAFLGDKIVFTYNREGRWYLAILDPITKKWEKLEQEGTYLHQLQSGRNCVRFLEQYSDKGEALVQIDDKPGLPITVLKSQPLPIEEGDISIPRHISFSSNGRTAYGFYYPPKNKNYQALQTEKPPLIVMIHGGPTAQATGSFQFEHQFWTNRGFAILDVNYGGSTGYGRVYRNLLNREWGIVDVEDCVNGALYLARNGLVDSDKLAIRGGSAGGYTTLAALAFKDTFKAGASYYGVADITALARDTHKFEKRYMEQLVGNYPEEKSLWESRSPIHSVDHISSPLILFQGEDDPIVPKNQAIMIYEALKKRDVIAELHIFPGEAHGFRQAKHLVESLNREVQFYLETFGLIVDSN